MLPVNYIDIYHESSCNYPEISHLHNDTKFANLNSLEYNKHVVDNSEIYPYYDLVRRNSKKNVILCCNNLLAREPNGVLLGYKCINDFGSDNTIFRLIRDSTITNIEFIRHNLLIITLESGILELWSTRADNSREDEYCPFRLSNKSNHYTTINALSFFGKNNTDIVTGDKLGTIHVWNVGAADLDIIATFRDLETSEITGLCNSTINQLNGFMGCLNNGSIKMWDTRTVKDNVIYSNSNNILSGICMVGQTAYVGDICGNVHAIDLRKADRHVKQTNIFQSEIYKFVKSEEGNKIAILERGKNLNIMKHEGQNEKYSQLPICKDMIRDVFWEDEQTLFCVGWGKYSSHQKLI